MLSATGQLPSGNGPGRQMSERQLATKERESLANERDWQMIESICSPLWHFLQLQRLGMALGIARRPGSVASSLAFVWP